jgi:hypothetical protein
VLEPDRPSPAAGGGPLGSACDERGRGGFGGLNLCRGAEDFFQGCQAGFDFVHAVGAEGFVALGSGQLADFGDGGALGDALFHGVVGDQQFVKADSAGVAEIVAAGAAFGSENSIDVAGVAFDLPAFADGGLVGFAAMLAEFSSEALAQNSAEGGADEIGFDAEIVEPTDGGGSVGGVHGAENQLAGEGILGGEPGGFGVGDFADHGDVRVLPGDAA